MYPRLAHHYNVLGRCLSVIVRAIQTDLAHRAGLTASSGARTGSVTLIQRFGSALNLNIHFHMLFLDGVYSSDSRPLRFRQTKAPSGIELTQLTHTIATRVGRYLERQGLLERENGQPYLTA